MFLRSYKRKENGKWHQYFILVENRRSTCRVISNGVHRQWFGKTAMDELLNTDYRIASKDRLYRCLDRILEHKESLCKHLKARWQNLFAIEFDVLLYDLTSTYFEGLCQQNPKATFGYSRDNRSDCRHPQKVSITFCHSREACPAYTELACTELRRSVEVSAAEGAEIQ